MALVRCSLDLFGVVVTFEALSMLLSFHQIFESDTLSLLLLFAETLRAAQQWGCATVERTSTKPSCGSGTKGSGRTCREEELDGVLHVDASVLHHLHHCLPCTTQAQLLNVRSIHDPHPDHIPEHAASNALLSSSIAATTMWGTDARGYAGNVHADGAQTTLSVGQRGTATIVQVVQ